MRRRVLLVLVSLVVAVPVGPAGAREVFPPSIPLPHGFYPEGIAVGRGDDFYAGSLLNGALFKGRLSTGEGAVADPGAAGRVVAGLTFDPRSRSVWGVGFEGPNTAAFRFDGATGRLVDVLEIPGTFFNDIVVTRTALYITDSFASVLWVVPLNVRGRPAGPPEPLPLSGDFEFVSGGPFPINLNGITATPDGRWLIAVHTALGRLLRIDPATGASTEIDVDGGDAAFGDGLVLAGRALYVVQNFLNQVGVVQLDPTLTTGRITRVITSNLFRVPTTGAIFANRLYLVNARFDVALPPFFGAPPVSIDYDVVNVRL